MRPDPNLHIVGLEQQLPTSSSDQQSDVGVVKKSSQK